MLDGLEKDCVGYSPEQFLSCNLNVSRSTLSLLKSLYDFTKVEEKKFEAAKNFVQVTRPGRKAKRNKFQLSSTELPLENLIIQSFDSEQVWEELQLQNALIYETLVSTVSKVLARNNQLPNVSTSIDRIHPENAEDDLKQEDSGESDEKSENGNIEDENEEGGSLDYADEDEEIGNRNHTDEDEEGGSEDDEKIDNDNEENVVKDLQGNESSKIDEIPVSNFEKRRKQIEDGIDVMEKEALQPKAWQFQGEVTADKRPENSLLEEHLIFDHLIRQAPEITAETTLRLEDIIKQRIKDQAWDDVIRKAKPVDNPTEYKKKLVLDSEKSRVGLSQIYEEEYIKQKKLEDNQPEAETIPKEQVEIEKDLSALFDKLNALSNFHYTPKPPSTEIRIITNAPAMMMEEVAPISVSYATMLAPQEILEPAPGEIKGKAERTVTDKKRERRIKKKNQKIKKTLREEKARAKGITLEHVTYADKKLKRSKTGADDALVHSKELKSSKAFFNKLQQEVQSQIKGTLAVKRKKDTSQLQAKKFKL